MNHQAKKLFISLHILCCMGAGSLQAMSEAADASKWAKDYYLQEMHRFNPSNYRISSQMASEQKCAIFLNFARTTVPHLGKLMEHEGTLYSAEPLFIESVKMVEEAAVDIMKTGLTGSITQGPEKSARRYFFELGQVLTSAQKYFSQSKAEDFELIKARSLKAQAVLSRSIKGQEDMRYVPLESAYKTPVQMNFWEEMGKSRNAASDFFRDYFKPKSE